MGRLNSRTSDVNSAPLTTPFTTDQQGLWSSIPWIRFVQQLYRGVQVAYDLGAQQTMDAGPGRDSGPEIQQAVEVSRDPVTGMLVGSIEELRRREAAADVHQVVDVDPVRKEIGAIETPHSYSDEIEQVRRLAFLADTPVPRPTVLLISDTHANRANYAAASYPDGTEFYETDRQTYYIVRGGQWWYYAGEMVGTISLPSTPPLPTDLGAQDVHFKFWASDLYHHYWWDSAAWHYADGDRSRRFVLGDNTGPGPGWAKCDGSTVTVANDDATTSAYTTPDSTANNFLEFGAYSGSAAAATAPTWDPSGVTTGVEDATHTHSLSGGGTTSGPNSTNSVAAGLDASVASSFHTHTYGSGSVGNESAQHHHSLSGTKLNPPSEGAGGLPSRLRFALWIRL